MSDDRRQQDRERLEAAVSELMSSEGFAKWLEARSKFHAYSLNNQLLIAMQAPEASRVAGYKTWQSLGRQVRKGEKAIRILAPMSFGARTRKCPDCSVPMKGSAVLSCPKCGLSTDGPRVLFKAVPVFDVSQTEGDDLPELPYEPLEGDSHEGYKEALETFAAELGHPVSYQDTGNKGGWCAKDEIVIDETASPNQQVATLVHELAHAMGIDYKDYSRHQAEVIVESVAYTVCRSIGLETSKSSVAYVAGWTDDPKTMKQFASTIDALAKRLEKALEKESVSV